MNLDRDIMTADTVIAKTPDPARAMYLFGAWLGLGALIQSTVNGIWLARRLGFEPVIWWGKTGFYTPPGSRENTYEALFISPAKPLETFNHPSFESCYPACYRKEFSVGNLYDLHDWVTHNGPEWTDWRESDRAILQNAGQAVCFQYLSEQVAWELASGPGVPVEPMLLKQQRAEIFGEFFGAQGVILQQALDFRQANFPLDQAVVGIHVRGTDKFTEVAVPSARSMILEAIRLCRQTGSKTIFLATDSEKAMAVCCRYCPPDIKVVFQAYRRGTGNTGLHYGDNAFQNAKDMMADVELLSQCQQIVAYPGSQIYGWIEMKLANSSSRTILNACKPSPADWMTTLFKIWKSNGTKALVQYMRMHKRDFLRWIDPRRVSNPSH